MSRSAALADCVSRSDADEPVPVELGPLLLVVVGVSSHETVSVPQPSDAAGVAPGDDVLAVRGDYKGRRGHYQRE
jgi:hypothetical protein